MKTRYDIAKNGNERFSGLGIGSTFLSFGGNME
jgi:hypothetical protein